MQLPSEINGYDGLRQAAQDDPECARGLNLLEQAFDERGIPPETRSAIGDLVIRLGYVAADEGLALDMTEWPEPLARLMGLAADVCQRWIELCEEE